MSDIKDGDPATLENINGKLNRIIHALEREARLAEYAKRAREIQESPNYVDRDFLKDGLTADLAAEKEEK